MATLISGIYLMFEGTEAEIDAVDQYNREITWTTDELAFRYKDDSNTDHYIYAYPTMSGLADTDFTTIASGNLIEFDGTNFVPVDKSTIQQDLQGVVDTGPSAITGGVTTTLGQTIDVTAGDIQTTIGNYFIDVTNSDIGHNSYVDTNGLTTIHPSGTLIAEPGQVYISDEHGAIQIHTEGNGGKPHLAFADDGTAAAVITLHPSGYLESDSNFTLVGNQTIAVELIDTTGTAYTTTIWPAYIKLDYPGQGLANLSAINGYGELYMTGNSTGFQLYPAASGAYFTSTVAGADPTQDIHFVTRSYMESNTQGLLVGDTASRPAGAPTGTMYFNTSLGYPMWFNGTNWVNATGAFIIGPA